MTSEPVEQCKQSKAQIPLRRLCDKVTSHQSSRHKLCRRLSWYVSATFCSGKFRWKSA